MFKSCFSRATENSDWTDSLLSGFTLQRSEEQLTTVLRNPPEFRTPTQRKRKVTDIRPKRRTYGGISGGNGAMPEVEGRGYRLIIE